jgi:hemolysin activation/secretion protein
VAAKHLITRSLFIKVLSFLVFTSTCSAESVNQYFKNNDSIVYKNKDTRSSNLNDKNPVIKVTTFIFSKLTDIDKYSVSATDLEEIISKDQKDNNNSYTIDRLESLAEKLSFYYREKGLILTKVFFPPQSLKNSSLYLDLVFGEIEKVTTIENDHYSNKRLIRPFMNLIDKPAYIPSLESSLIQINDYPGLSIDTRFKEGSKIGRTQIDIHVKKEELTDFNFSFDNYGSEYTGTMRSTFTADFYNLSDQADKLSFNILATLNPTNAIFLGTSYRLNASPYFNDPLLNTLFKYGLNVTFGYQESQYTVGREFEVLDLKGKASTASIKIDKDLILRSSHRLNTGIKISKKLAKISQQNQVSSENKISILTWSTLLRWNDYLTSPAANLIKFDFHKGLPNFAGSMENNDSDISRTGLGGEIAAMDYSRYNLLISRNQGIGPYQLLTKINIQHTQDLLLPSEQSNLGGAASVRGYLNSDFNGDTSRVISIEIIGKSSARKFSLPISDLKLAAFIDHGKGKRIKALKDELSSSEMTSIGGYAQFIKEGQFSSKIELAMPLLDAGESNKNKFEVLFNFDREF